jgi:hypothetical protein
LSRRRRRGTERRGRGRDENRKTYKSNLFFYVFVRMVGDVDYVGCLSLTAHTSAILTYQKRVSHHLSYK